jgi:hypothetical membrane protein
MQRMNPMRPFKRYAARYPFLGPIVYLSSLQYFIIQFVVAAAWTTPYSMSFNVISDLGNTVCGQFGDRYVCSPEHGLMNLSFGILGITMALGSLLIYQEFKRTWLSFTGFMLMALAGVGTVLVGLFPENVNSFFHALGAFMAFGLGGLSLVVLAKAITQARPIFRIYTALSGVICLTALVLFVIDINLGLGHGGMERLISYPQTIWLILFGIYMTATRGRAYMQKRRAT